MPAHKGIKGNKAADTAKKAAIKSYKLYLKIPYMDFLLELKMNNKKCQSYLVERAYIRCMQLFIKSYAKKPCSFK